MIYFEGLSSIIESIYLNDLISNKLNHENVYYVNPDNIKYLVGKNIIINTVEYPVEKILQLLKNDCNVISRVYFPELKELNVQPYILKIHKNIMWNGQYVDKYKDLNKLYLDNQCHLDWEHYTLTFPKIKPEVCEEITKLTDLKGNLTVLGWALQQVGVNIITDTLFCNLDLYKLGKIIP